MPPKVKFTKEEIVKASLLLVRERGVDALNARELAGRLQCSTQPIFSNFETMEELQRAVQDAAFSRYLDFLQAELESGQYPAFKAYGMGYIRFAKEEKELFKMIFMCDREGTPPERTVDAEIAIDMIMQANGISREKAEIMHLESWVCVHGIATMLATSFFSPSWDLISDMLTDIYQGLRLRHLSKEEEK